MGEKGSLEPWIGAISRPRQARSDRLFHRQVLRILLELCLVFHLQIFAN